MKKKEKKNLSYSFVEKEECLAQWSAPSYTSLVLPHVYKGKPWRLCWSFLLCTKALAISPKHIVLLKIS